jgi:hypothetical protein
VHCFNRWMGLTAFSGLITSLAGVAAGVEGPASALTHSVAYVPILVGPPWQIAGDPDLGELTSPKQQPVDFGIWQAADRTWQLWSCIRGTKCGGMTRLFYRWEGKALTDRDWKPMGVAMQANAKFGETPGGLQAPFVTLTGDAAPKYLMFYGDWAHICMARSQDGKTFERWLMPDGRAGMFGGQERDNTRDPMAFQIGDRWYCYCTAHPGKVGADYCRTSTDLRHWSEEKMVARGGQAGRGPGSAECPFVVALDGYFYLFRTQRYGEKAKTSIYRSRDPMNFGVDSDEFLIETLPVAAPEIIHHDGAWYLASLLPSLKGIQMYHLEWGRATAASRPTQGAR